MQAVGKIVGAAGGEIAQGRPMAALQQAGNRFVEGAVAPGADDEVKFLRATRDGRGGVASGGGGVDRDVIAAAVENVDDVGKGAAGLFLAGTGIDDQKKLFHPCSLRK